MALERANAVRFARARTKRELRYRSRYPDSLRVAAKYILDPPDHLASMTIGRLLDACYGVGRPRAERILWRSRITSSVRLGDLRRDERARLVQSIAEFAGAAA